MCHSLTFSYPYPTEKGTLVYSLGQSRQHFSLKPQTLTAWNWLTRVYAGRTGYLRYLVTWQSYDFNVWRLSLQHLMDQSDFLVAGVLGKQGVGKSTVMSLLAGTRTGSARYRNNDDNRLTNTSFYSFRPYLFKTQSKETHVIYCSIMHHDMYLLPTHNHRLAVDIRRLEWIWWLPVSVSSY